MVHRSGSYTAGDEQYFLLLQFFDRNVHKIGRIAERADDIGETVAFLKERHAVRLRTDRLKYNCHRALFLVIVADGQRYPLSFFIDADHQKLSRKCMSCNPRSFHSHAVDVRGKLFLFQDFEHGCLLEDAH